MRAMSVGTLYQITLITHNQLSLYQIITRSSNLISNYTYRWTQSTAHPNGSIDILFLGSKYEEMSFMHIVGNAESRCRTKVRGAHIMVVWLVFLAEFTSIHETMCVRFDSTTRPESLSQWQSRSVHIYEGCM